MRLNLNVKHVNIESLKREGKNQTLRGLRKRAQQTKSRWLEKIPLSSLNGKFFASLSISLYTPTSSGRLSLSFLLPAVCLIIVFIATSISMDFRKKIGTARHLKMLIMQFYKFYDFHILSETV